MGFKLLLDEVGVKGYLISKTFHGIIFFVNWMLEIYEPGRGPNFRPDRGKICIKNSLW